MGFKMNYRIIATILAVLMPLASHSQTLSAADLKAQVDAAMGGLNEYQVLLNDPDPARSMKAMQIMMASGEPELVRMAREFGLFSPNVQVQRAALEAFFNSSPVLELNIKSAGLDITNFGSTIRGSGGTVFDDGSAFLSLKVGDFDKEQACYLNVGYGSCLIRFTETALSINTWGGWSPISLNERGNLEGLINIQNADFGVPTIIVISQ